MAVGAAAEAATTAVPAAMSVWRVQVELTTTSRPAGRFVPAVRLNATSEGVTNLNPFFTEDFTPGRTVRFDLRLVPTAADLTMLRLGTPTGEWCLSKVSLLVNERYAFTSTGGCTQPGRPLEFGSATLRANPSWTSYGSAPARPTSMSIVSLRERTLSAIGSAMPANVSWDRTLVPTFNQESSATVRVRLGVVVSDPSGIEAPFTAGIIYGVEPRGGAAVTAVRVGPVGSYEFGLPGAAVDQVSRALQRMAGSPALGMRLVSWYDAFGAVVWANAPLVVG